MTTHAEKILDENTPVPFAWVLKSLGVVLIAAPVIWWAASLQASVIQIGKQVEPIPQMAQDIARLKDKNGLTFQEIPPKSDLSVVIRHSEESITPKEGETIIKAAYPQDQSDEASYEVAVIPKERLTALEKCHEMFGKGNAANSCVKLVMK
jgi:hypothetical protein